jgi:uncharacterized protein (DUF2141 family)
MHASLRPSNATSASQAGRPRSNRWWGALTGLAIAVAALDSDAGATQVRVLIESATPGRGPVRVAVVGEAASRRFPGIGPTDVLAHASLEARSAPIETVFELPPGRYAITVFQDTDQDGELALSLQGEMTRSVWKGCSGSGACFLDLGLKTEIGPRKLFWSDVIYRVESGYSEQFFEVDDPQGWKLSGCEQTRMTGPRQLDLVRDSQRAQQIQDQILQSSVLTGVREMAESQASINTLHDQLRGLIDGRYGPIIIQQDPETLRNGFLNHPQYQQWRTLVPIRQVHRVRPAVRPQQNLNRPLIRPH